jgi:hypothetical protein
MVDRQRRAGECSSASDLTAVWLAHAGSSCAVRFDAVTLEETVIPRTAYDIYGTAIGRGSCVLAAATSRPSSRLAATTRIPIPSLSSLNHHVEQGMAHVDGPRPGEE